MPWRAGRCWVKAFVSPFLPLVWHPPELAKAPQLELGTGLGVIVTHGMFGKDDGQIQWYGIIATVNMSCEFWAGKGWGGSGCAGTGRRGCSR